MTINEHFSNNNIIDVSNVSFSYRIKNTFIRDLSFKIKKNEIIGLVGPNGAGKSTLFNLIYSILQPLTGEIKLFEELLTPNNENSIKKNIGYLPQVNSLFDHLTVEENLYLACYLYKIPKNKTGEKVKKLKSILGIEDLTDKLFNNLSGGQKKIVCFAASIIHRPNLMLLDEPFESLDLLNQNRVLTIIKDLSLHESTIFISSHIIEPLEGLCDRYFIMNEGKIKSILNNEDIINSGNNLYSIVKEELGIGTTKIDSNW